MTEDDFGTFDRAFRRVCGAFRLRLKVAEVEDLTRTYFRVLAHAPLDEVLAAGKVCLSQSRTFPKAAEWLQALPAAPPTPAADVRVMSTAERAEYARAEALRYADDPCACPSCQAAYVTDQAVRFVPDETDAGVFERALDMERHRVVVTGHWAHGDELARWYVARDAFFASAPRKGPLRRVLALVGAGREPGSDDD